jgi:hypothetical protein
MRQKDAVLRVCASCEWIFRRTEYEECPKCGFAHYGARFVYGDKAYRYLVTQKPWFDKKMEVYASGLRQEIAEAAVLQPALLCAP